MSVDRFALASSLSSKSRRTRPLATAVAPVAEQLESRVFLSASLSSGTLKIRGTNAPDVITAGLNAADHTKMDVTINGVVKQFAVANVRKLDVNTKKGADVFTVDETNGLIQIKSKIKGDKGNDSLVGGSGNDSIDGGGGLDTLVGNDGNDTLKGGGSNPESDSLLGGNGNDKLDGKKGADFLDGGAGADRLIGNDGADTVSGGDGVDNIDGGKGNDFIINLDGFQDVVKGSKGFDSADATDITGTLITEEIATGIEQLRPPPVTLVSGALSITGTGAADKVLISESAGTLSLNYRGLAFTFNTTDVTSITVDGQGGDDTVTIDSTVSINSTVVGGTGNDSITTGGGDDSVDGGAGNDLIDAGLGDDAITGGDGVDTASYATRTQNLTLAIGTAGNGQGSENDTIGADVENLIGGDGADTLTGSLANNSLSGGNGDDEIAGGEGNDTVDGGAGQDLLDGENGNDVIINLDGERDTVRGSAGTDTADNDLVDDILGTIDPTTHVITGGDVESLTATGIFEISSTSGNDVIVLHQDASGLTVSLNGVTTQPQDLTGFTGIRVDALEGDDSVTTDGTVTLPITISGGDGNDTLGGSVGSDNIDGGEGNDSITGGAGADVLTGGAGSDIIVNLDGVRDVVRGGTGTDIAQRDSVDDFLGSFDAQGNLIGGDIETLLG